MHTARLHIVLVSKATKLTFSSSMTTVKRGPTDTFSSLYTGEKFADH